MLDRIILVDWHFQILFICLKVFFLAIELYKIPFRGNSLLIDSLVIDLALGNQCHLQPADLFFRPHRFAQMKIPKGPLSISPAISETGAYIIGLMETIVVLCPRT